MAVKKPSTLPTLTCVSYKALEPARAALLRKMQAEIERPGMGPEALRTTAGPDAPDRSGNGARP